MKWVTRQNVKVDRLACAWFVKRFLDPEAQFVFVQEDNIHFVMETEGAIAFDAPGLPFVRLNHRPSKCSFDSFLADYKIQNAALSEVANAVRAADGVSPLDSHPWAHTLRRLAEGFNVLALPDEQRLQAGMVLFDALHAISQQQAAGK